MTAEIVLNFIEEVWNGNAPHLTYKFLHPDFADHSLPEGLPPNAEGLQKWIYLNSASFEHYTAVDDQVTEGEKSIVKVSMRLKHIGAWRGIPATGKEITTIGYRFFRLKENKIIEHWALIDGNNVENQLKDLSKGCKNGRINRRLTKIW